jgi:hypothetical protein
LTNPDGSDRFETIGGQRYGIFRDSTLALSEDSIEKQLALMARGKGNYELYFINNGIDSQGLPEFFYVFVPYRAGTWAVDGTRIRFNNPTGFDTNFPAYHADNEPRGAKPVQLPTGVTLVEHNGYLYTRGGHFYRDVVVKEQLTKTSTDRPVQRTLNNRVEFTGTALLSSFAFDTSFPKALGAMQGSHVIGGFIPTRRYDVYSDSSGTEIIRRESGRPADADTNFRYGVIMSTHQTSVGYADGTVGFNYRVFNAETNRIESMILRPMTGEPTTGANRVGNGLAVGTFIAFIPRADNSVDAVVLGPNAADAPQNASTEEERDVLRGDNARYSAWVAHTSAEALRVGANRLNLSAAGTSLAMTGLGTNNREALLNANTRVIVFSPNGGGTGIASAALYNPNNLPTATEGVTHVGFVAGGSGANISNAQAVLVRATGAIQGTMAPEVYATILDWSGGNRVQTTSGTFNTRKAFIYSTNTVIDVCGPDSLLQTGLVVALTGRIYENYTLVQAAGTADDGSRLLANTGANRNRGQLGTSFSNALTSGVNTTQGGSTGTLHTAVTIAMAQNDARAALRAAFRLAANQTAVSIGRIEAAIGFATAEIAGTIILGSATPAFTANSYREALLTDPQTDALWNAFINTNFAPTSVIAAAASVSDPDVTQIEAVEIIFNAAIDGLGTLIKAFWDANRLTTSDFISGTEETVDFRVHDDGGRLTTITGRVTGIESGNRSITIENEVRLELPQGNLANNIVRMVFVQQSATASAANRALYSASNPATWENSARFAMPNQAQSAHGGDNGSGLFSFRHGLWLRDGWDNVYGGNVWAVATVDNDSGIVIALTIFLTGWNNDHVIHRDNLQWID